MGIHSYSGLEQQAVVKRHDDRHPDSRNHVQTERCTRSPTAPCTRRSSHTHTAGAKRTGTRRSVCATSGTSRPRRACARESTLSRSHSRSRLRCQITDRTHTMSCHTTSSRNGGVRHSAIAIAGNSARCVYTVRGTSHDGM